MPDALPRISLVPAASPMLAVEFTRREITAVRGAVSRHAAEAGMQGERLHDFVLAVNEIVTNAVVHGGGHGELRLWTVGQTLGCDITDEGPQAGAETAAAGDAQADGSVRPSEQPQAGADGHAPVDGERGGRGLMLARLLVDSLDVQHSPNGTAVRVISALPV